MSGERRDVHLLARFPFGAFRGKATNSFTGHDRWGFSLRHGRRCLPEAFVLCPKHVTKSMQRRASSVFVVTFSNGRPVEEQPNPEQSRVEHPARPPHRVQHGMQRVDAGVEAKSDHRRKHQHPNANAGAHSHAPTSIGMGIEVRAGCSPVTGPRRSTESGLQQARGKTCVEQQQRQRDAEGVAERPVTDDGAHALSPDDHDVGTDGHPRHARPEKPQHAGEERTKQRQKFTRIQPRRMATQQATSPEPVANAHAPMVLQRRSSVHPNGWPRVTKQDATGFQQPHGQVAVLACWP